VPGAGGKGTSGIEMGICAGAGVWADFCGAGFLDCVGWQVELGGTLGVDDGVDGAGGGTGGGGGAGDGAGGGITRCAGRGCASLQRRFHSMSALMNLACPHHLSLRVSAVISSSR